MADLVTAISPPDEWLDRLARLIGAAPVNLVSRGDRHDVRRRHLDECVLVARQLRLAVGARWMDLGTGGGLPGLVLAAAFPSVSWTLLDARAKKITQVDAFVSTLGLHNVHTRHARAEDLWSQAHWRGSFNGVISRAVASVEQTTALSRPFITNGEIIAIRGADAPAQARALAHLTDGLGLAIHGVQSIDGTIRPTWLIRMRGHGPLPPGFSKIWRTLSRPGFDPSHGGTRDDSA